MSDGPRTTAAETRIAQLEHELAEFELGEEGYIPGVYINSSVICDATFVVPVVTE